MSEMGPASSELQRRPKDHVVETAKPTRDNMNEITGDSDSDGQNDLDMRTGHKSDMGHEKLGSGHFDPLQRKIYLGLHVFSLATALLGLLLLSIWIFKYKGGVSLAPSKEMGNLHALFMYTFMVGLNAYGVLVYRTFFSAKKETLKWAHAILSFVNIVMATTGVTLMFVSHGVTKDPNLYTLHSWIGLTTNTLYVSQFLFGFVTFLKPGLSQSVREFGMPLHRFGGIALLAMAGLAAITGIAEWAIWSVKDYGKFVPLTFIVNFTGACVLISTLVSVYLLSQERYRRPIQPEHQSLSGKMPE